MKQFMDYELKSQADPNCQPTPKGGWQECANIFEFQIGPVGLEPTTKGL